MSRKLLKGFVSVLVIAIGATSVSAADVPPARLTVESVPVVLNPLNVPADPGKVGLATAAGVDVNKNGVRDDAERWIGEHFPRCARYRAALAQVALVVQKKIIAKEITAEAAAALNREEGEATSCLAEVSDSCADASMENFIKFSLLLENTPERIKGYITATSKAPAVLISGTGNCMIPLANLPD